LASHRHDHVIKVDDLPGSENASTFIVQDGEVLFTVGERTINATAGDIVVVPARTPHKFLCRSGPHRQFSIHPVARMETEWLE
jgi:mannose-6-phosphate isomerase-like protein (cupin superfamily)